MLAVIAACCAERNGYALHFPGFGTLAHPRLPSLDPNNLAIASLANGFTLTMWLRFDNLDPDRFVYPIALVHESDQVFFGPFGGMHGGFQMNVAVDTVSSLGQNASCWHHFAESWDQSTGEIVIYIDGKELKRESGVGQGVTFLDKRATLMLGSRCHTVSPR